LSQDTLILPSSTGTFENDWLFSFSFFFFVCFVCGTGVGTQGFAFARQALLSFAPNLHPFFALGYFLDSI
jgi:hypothetical protein